MSSLVGLKDALGLSAGGYDLCAVVSSPQVISSATDGSRHRRDRLSALSWGDISRPLRTTLCPTETSIRWRPRWNPPAWNQALRYSHIGLSFGSVSTLNWPT